MKEYAKNILYAYPLLETVEKDYEEHIRNRALLSYDSRKRAEELAEYIAGEILEMRRLEWVKGIVQEVLKGLSEVEKTLLAARYFGKRKGARKLIKGKGTPVDRLAAWTERTYFRRLRRTEEKASALLAQNGLTEKAYLERLSGLEIFKRIERKRKNSALRKEAE